MYHAACKVEFKLFNRSYSQLRLPGCQVSGLRTNIKHRITSLDQHQHINTNGNMQSFAPDTTKLSGTAEKQHVRKSKCHPCLSYQVQSSTCICPYCVRAEEPHQQPCRVGDKQYEYVLLWYIMPRAFCATTLLPV